MSQFYLPKKGHIMYGEQLWICEKCGSEVRNTEIVWGGKKWLCRSCYKTVPNKKSGDENK